jgi:hypothetical protein
MDGTLLAHCGTEKMGREQLALVPYPAGSATHKVIPHHECDKRLGRHTVAPAYRAGA